MSSQTISLEKIPKDLLAPALEIVQRLRGAGYCAYFAGGSVRDLLLGRPIEDIDIATDAPPERVSTLFENTLLVGARFGVVVVLTAAGPYEVTTFRSDGSYLDGRHPSEVHFGSAQDDAARRDFTINGLFLDPVAGRIIDYVGGAADLELRTLRAIGNPIERFREDKLRLLRALRFACDLNFQIEHRTLEALSGLPQGIDQVSRERVRDELNKILVGANPARGLELMQATGLLAQVLPEVGAMVGVSQPPEFHPEGDVFVHTCLMFRLSPERSLALGWGILLHDVGKPPTRSVKERIRFDGHVDVGVRIAEEIGRRLRLSNDQLAQILDLVGNHLRFMHVAEMRDSKLKRFLRKENFAEHLELHRLDCLASHGDLTNYEFCRRRLAELSRQQIEPEPLINGSDLIALGYTPGPQFRVMLEQVEDAQLEGEIADKEQALAWIRKKFPRSAPRA